MSQIVRVFACLALVFAFAARDGFPGRRVGGGSRVVQEILCPPSFPACPI